MKFEIVDKNEVINMLDDDCLYMLRIRKDANMQRYSTCKPISKYLIKTMTVRGLTDMITNPNTAFIRITDET